MRSVRSARSGLVLGEFLLVWPRFCEQQWTLSLHVASQERGAGDRLRGERGFGGVNALATLAREALLSWPMGLAVRERPSAWRVLRVWVVRVRTFVR